VVADVTVQNRQALREAALRVLDGGLVLIGEASDEEADLPDSREEIAASDGAAVQWCLEPTAGMELLLESGVVRILSIDMGCDEVEADHAAGAGALVRATWTVTVKIHDAHGARELALAACPVTDAEAHPEVERSFAAVWHWTAPPYAPMAGIPGVTWVPVGVTVEQVLARPR
jgi:hypothetical protein